MPSYTQLCAGCDGKGSIGPVHINRGNAPHEWRESIPCVDCGGSGRWSEERAKAYAEGQRYMRARMDAQVSLFERAQELGVKPSQLSAYEHGRAPFPEPPRPKIAVSSICSTTSAKGCAAYDPTWRRADPGGGGEG